MADLAQGRQPIGFIASLFKRDLKAALAQVRVEGKAPAGSEDWSIVEETRRWRNSYRAFLDCWPGLPALPELPDALANPRGDHSLDDLPLVYGDRCHSAP